MVIPGAWFWMYLWLWYVTTPGILRMAACSGEMQLPPEGHQEGKGKERGRVANIIYIFGRWAHPLLCKWKTTGSMKKKIISVSLFWKVKKALLASGNGLRGGGSALLICCKCVNSLWFANTVSFFKAKPAKFLYYWVSSLLTKVCDFCSSISTTSWMRDTP